MNLQYWDRHKVAAVVTAVFFILSFAIWWVADDIDTIAWDKAVDTLSYADAEVIVSFLDSYEKQLPGYYNTLDSLGTWIFIFAIIGALFTAWTALNIPERYTREIAPTATTPPTTAQEPSQ